GNKPVPQQQPRTLMELHDALVRVRPSPDAPLEQWQAYYHRSAVLYAEIAEIDRGHHHEALYWAERELEKAKQVTGAIKTGATSWDPWSESAHFPQ
ncbi:MAG: AMED_5909 family protein, partial [Pseudonocardiaceae bacterium]